MNMYYYRTKGRYLQGVHVSHVVRTHNGKQEKEGERVTKPNEIIQTNN